MKINSIPVQDKGDLTKARILKACMDYVCQYGLASISIGEVAKRTNMSRTGVISHFKNKANMQIAILKYCESVFIEQVIKPSLHIDPVVNLQQFYHNWVNWVFKVSQKQNMTCPFLKAAAEFQDRPKDSVKALIHKQQVSSLAYITSLVERCVSKEQFSASLNCRDFAITSLGYYLSHNLSRNLLNDSSADQRFLRQIDRLISSALHK